ncbi:RING finger protein 223-like [Heptranchias perlo]|uniref:RING finger protein 223-like n=1 Tax=Heptranchias perlo TaxID=212740 RepID=UPI0035599038
MAVEREETRPQRSISECPVCYLVYDNASKTPLLLPCGHTFCLECLARICIFMKQDETFPCPLCRTAVSIPPGGVPKLNPDLQMMSAFPPGLQTAQKVWLEGSRLCWLEGNEADDIATVVTLQLLPHPNPELSGPSHLVGVHHTPRISRYWIFSNNCCCLSLLIMGGLVMVFGIIFFPAYLIKGL